jgi:pimeloyl-ACP methyl ester carboxylesterase
MPLPEVKYARTDALEIAYEESGSSGAEPIFLLHGFPYDPRAYDAMVPRLVEAGYRTIVPYLRGYGPTRFLKTETPRSGQQAALAHDLLALMDALRIERAAHVGYDWGGRAACILAALSPQRVRCLVSQGGYNIHDIPGSVVPAAPEQEYRFWYQYYFHTERGRAGLAKNRREFCRLLWRLWSPHWQFDAETFERTAKSFDNADFVDVVIQSYRHRYAYAAGDPALESIEQQLIAQPAITVPTIVLHGEADGIQPVGASLRHAAKFTGFYERRTIARAGHNLPQEVPEFVCKATLDLLART